MEDGFVAGEFALGADSSQGKVGGGVEPVEGSDDADQAIKEEIATAGVDQLVHQDEAKVGVGEGEGESAPLRGYPARRG